MTSTRTLPIRRWLALSLFALFLAPVLTMLVIGFLLFRPTHGPVGVEQRVETRLLDGADRWDDPAWRADIAAWLAGEDVDVVLVEDGQVVFRTSDEPLADADDTSRMARRFVLPGSDGAQVAYIYADQRSGPPEELREWFVPVALIGALVLTLAGIAWFLRRSIVDPITATSAAAHRVAAGELDVDLPGSRVREVAELSAAFEGMAASLKASLQRQTDLEQERRMFIGAIVHDLRTPLFSLRGSLEGLATGVASTPEMRDRYIAVARDKAEALERLVADLFAFVRVEYLDEVPAKASLALESFLLGIADGVHPRAEAKSVRVALAGSPAPVSVLADAHMLTRAIENLLDNALRHTPEGGTVQLAWRQVGDRVEIAVSDTGPGIPPEDLAHIFEPLFRGESSRSRRTGGAGLGLAIARRIVLAHGGEIAARNHPDGGAVFVVSLPVGGVAGG